MIQKKYFFVLGRNPGLSLLEIDAALSSVVTVMAASSTVALAEGYIDNPNKTLARLGGIIKIGICETEFDALPLSGDALIQKVADWITQSFTKNAKRTLGFSVYSLARHEKLTYDSRHTQRLGISVKKELRDRGYSIRAVLPQKSLALTSVQVDKNNLLDGSNKEVVVIVDENKISLGSTLAVQEFEAYSFRDWQRPSKETARGMLPPKLAQIMLNLALRNASLHAHILDPFCGVGTLVSEALLMGYEHVSGSDIDEKAVASTKQNLAWLMEQKKIIIPNSPSSNENKQGAVIKQADARALHACYPPYSLDAIATEPYLGPLYERMPQEKQLQKNIDELSDLYLAFLREAKHILKPGGRLCMVWPVWMQKQKQIFLPILPAVTQLGYRDTTIPNEFPFSIPERTHRNSVLVARIDAVVGREIIVLTLQNGKA